MKSPLETVCTISQYYSIGLLAAAVVLAALAYALVKRRFILVKKSCVVSRVGRDGTTVRELGR